MNATGQWSESEKNFFAPYLWLKFWTLSFVSGWKVPSGLEHDSAFIIRWKGGLYCFGPIGKSVSHCLITCSDCWSYIQENVCVLSAVKHVTFLGTMYENFAFFSAIWLGSIVCPACSFFISHTLLSLSELICVVFVIFHCNSDFAHSYLFKFFLMICILTHLSSISACLCFIRLLALLSSCVLEAW